MAEQRLSQLADQLWPYLARRVAAGNGGGSSGISFTPSAHGALTGLLGDDHPQYLRTDGARTLTGNLAVASGITIDGIDISAHATNPAAHHDPVTVGAGLGLSGQQVSLTTPGGLSATTTNSASGSHTHAIATGTASTLTVASTNTTGTGTNLARADHTHAITSSSNPGAAASILATDASGYLSLVRLVTTDRVRTPLIDTASGSLTLAPAGNVVSVAASAALQTANYASQLTGWRVTYGGEADFRYLFVDEMHAKSFIADLEQALAGGQIISKSVAMVAAAFTAPAAGGTATLRVRDLPSAPDMAVFQGGDIVRLRTFSRVNGSLSIEDAWGVVTNYIDQTDGTQTWTFTRSSAPNSGAMLAGTVIQPDSLVLDYGVAGNGFYEVNAIDGQYGQNSPYARIATWTGHPATGTALRAQFGNLRGVYGYPPDTSVFGVAMGDSTGANVTVDATNGVRLRNGTTDKIVLAPDGSSYFAGVMTIGTSGEIRQGTGTIGSNFTGLRIWRDGSIGRIAGYNNNVLQWYGGTDGYLYGGAGTAAINRYGYLISDVDISGGATWPFSYGGLHSVANVSTPTTNYRGSLMFGTPPGVYANAPRSWFVHYPGTLPASIPVGGGASLPLALMISDDSGNGPWAVWHAGNDGAASGLDADLLDGYHASAFALLSGAIFNGNVSPNTGGTRDLGTSGAPWRRIYVDEVIASTITGSTGLVGSVWQNDPSDMYIRSNSSSARTLYIANPGTGLMHLDVEGNITLGGTVDGVDVSAHAADVNAHHARSHAITSTSDHTASGLTAGQVLRATGSTTFAWQQLAHGDLSGIGTNTHAQIDTHIGTTDIHVAHSSVSITAGDGLTGGGTIAATRTLTLGTPGSSTATSTNAVTATSHTHAIDSTIARSAITVSAGNGLTGGGDLTANRTLTLGTPGGLDAGTTNAVTSTSHTHAITANVAASALTVASTAAVGTSAALARADHIHAITTSSNPGAAASILATNSSGYLRLVRLGIGKDPTSPLDVSGAAAISGALSAGSGAITGALTVGGDLTVGSTVLQVSASGTRVGINRAADSQFDLDVAGAIRGQYLVGKHAIQLSSALGVWHFDGPAPYNLDFSGSNVSHTGVGGTESGGVIYRPGKFGKAVQLAEATTNLLTNPSFETNTTGWGTDYPATTTLTRTAGGLYGDYYLAVAATGNGNCFSPAVTVANATAYAVSFWYRTTSSVRVYVREYGNATDYGTATLPAATEWTRYTILLTTPASASTSIRLVFYDLAVGESIDIDGVQIEKKPYVTPYCDGSLGQGHSWSGTPHASTSSRTGATLQYANAGGLSVQAGTILMWARHAGMATSGMGLWGTGSNAQFDAYVNQVGSIYFRQSNTNQSVGAGIQPQTWNHYAFTWSKSANTRKIFVNGVERSSRQFDAGASIGSTLFVGSLTAGAAYGTNGEIDEFTLLDYAADPKLIRAIYESDAPVFVESSVFHWRSPSRVPIWVDEFGLWARGVSGNEILGLYGGDPRNPTGNVTRSWGGITMEENDVVIGRAAQAAVHWDDSAGTLLIGKPSAGNLLLSGGALKLRNSTTDMIALNSDGSATIAGALSLGSSGGIYQGTGSFGSPTTGLKIWNESGIGRIAGFGSGTLQWSANTSGKLTAGAGDVILDADGITQMSDTDETGSAEPPLSPLLPVMRQRISLRDKPGSMDWGYNNIYDGPQYYSYPGMEWLRLYVSSQHFVQWYTGSIPQNWHAWDSVIEVPSNAIPSHAGTVVRRRLLLKAPEIALDGKLQDAKFATLDSTPANPTNGVEARVYMRSNKLIIQYNDGGTIRYKYLQLSGTGVTWVHTTTAP